MMLCTGHGNGQDKSGKIVIKGRVTDGSGSPVANAIILLDGERTNSVTGQDGLFRVKVRSSPSKIGVLTFDMGFFEEDIRGRNMVDLRFKKSEPAEIAAQLPEGEEYIDVGYNYVKKKNLSNAVASVDFRNSKRTYSSIYEMIRELPGVWISGNSIVLPGSRNLYGYIGPVVIVDGIRGVNISSIPPSNVESIVLLKDAGAAIYGSEGFGGALLIRTKKTLIDNK